MAEVQQRPRAPNRFGLFPKHDEPWFVEIASLAHVEELRLKLRLLDGAIGNFLSVALLLWRECENVQFKEQIHELLLLAWFHNLFKCIRKAIKIFASENKVPTVWYPSDIIIKQLFNFVLEVFFETVETSLDFFREIRFYEVI